MKFIFPLLSAFIFSSCAFAGVTITTSTLPNGTVDTAYQATLQVAGGCTPYSWSVYLGKLPAGIVKTQMKNGVGLGLSGDPTTAASYSFSMEVTDCKRNVAKAAYKVVIQPGANHVVNLDWKPSSSTGVAGYNLYRSIDGASWQKLNPKLIASTVYSDSTVADKTTYYYAATTVDIHGDESTKSSTIKAVVP